MARAYTKIPIVEAARRCGLVLDSRTLRRDEVEASCPFCGDHGPGKHHLSLNTMTDQYRCNLCGASGNSVSLYARIHGVSNKEAYLELVKDGKVYPMPSQPDPQTQERRPRALEEPGCPQSSAPKGVAAGADRRGWPSSGCVCLGSHLPVLKP